MNKNLQIFILLSIFIVVHGAQEQCSCTQLKSENDCLKFPLQHCEWLNNTCILSNQSTSNPVIVGKPFCSQYQTQYDCKKAFICSNCQNKQVECDGCLKSYPCVWENSQCQFFTGCTAYAKISHQECNEISKECTSDLTQCIPIGECTEYPNINACKQKNIHGQQCTWDPQLLCKELGSCSEIQKQYSTSHDACNNQLSKCTVNENQQCVDLATDCGGYTFEDQCKVTSNNVKCAWSNNTCRDINCEDAPLNINTDIDCKKFISGCVARAIGGGCEKIITCQDIKNQSDCLITKEQSGKSCYWLGSQNQCVIHECAYAPLDYQSDKQCQSFRIDCINNEGVGCKLNLGCSAITNQLECNTNKSAEGKDCLWDEECKEKTCENASKKLITHEQCERYLFSCTTDYGYGCQEKTCKNAPDTMKTNEDCERYLPNHHCITRSGGGCIKNDSCSKVSIAIACVRDINGSDCQWYDVTGVCITKQCDKAPTTIKTQEQCEAFWSKCQVNSSGTGCEDKICENFQQEGKCKGQLDFYGRSCSWRNKCVLKSCQNASLEFKTHEDCNDYLNTCTLSQTGKGCTSLPLTCDFIKLEEGCRLRQSIGLNNVISIKQCAWKNNQCQDKTCLTAPITRNTNLLCQDYLEGCYVNNERQGCWKLPECSLRSLQETCEVTSYDCVWDGGHSKCQVRNCASSLFGSDKNNYTTAQSCYQYRLNAANCSKPEGLGCCTLNNDGKGCMIKPDNCSQLKTQNNCGEKSLYSGGDCLWIGISCEPKSCDALTKNFKFYNQQFNHSNCYQSSFSTCTVNENSTACISLKSSCSQYQANDQCKVDSNGNECAIRYNPTSNLFTCDIEKCGDEITKNHDSFADCQSYNEICTVIARVGKKGCVDKQQYCFNYKFQEQCYKNLSGKKCVWNNKRCWDHDKIDCSIILLDNYSTQTCESVAPYCKANLENTKCILKTCADYTTQTQLQGGPQVSQLSHCQALKANNVRCSINKALNACVVEQDRCNSYQPDQCYNSKLEGLCKTNGTECYKQFQACSTWNSENDAGCQIYRDFCKYPPDGVGRVACTNKSCDDKVGSNLTEEICYQFDESCTVSLDKTKCILIQSSCGTYGSDENLCIKQTQSNCIFVKGTPDECVGILSSVDAEKYCKLKVGVGLTYDVCQLFSPLCSVNRAGTNCVARKQCGGYTAIEQCYRSEIEYCIQSKFEDQEATCLSFSNLTCEQIFLGKTTVYSHEKCSQVNKTCTNSGTSGCTIKTCQNAVGPFTHESCVAWKSTCTVKKAKDGCQEMEKNCLDYLYNDCLVSVLDGICTQDVTQNKCVKKSCYSSDDTLTTDAQCEAYMPTCTVAQTGGCMLRSTCDSYITELQCIQDNQNRLCFWNPSQRKCVLFDCKSIEATDKYDTHAECYGLKNIQDPKKQNKYQKCTINFIPDPDDQTKVIPKGCMNLLGCNEYKYKEQCVIDSNGSFCRWNTDNPENEFCEQTTCLSADPNTFITHENCREYQLNVNTQYQDKCTVAVVEISPGVLQARGCRYRADCEEYKIEDQCRYSATGQECIWDKIDQACFTRICSKAPLTFTSHDRCNEFSPKCTLSSNQTGCMDQTPKCEDYQVKSQCTKSIYGNLCHWNGVQCVTRQCSNTPEDLNGKCSTYLDTCEDSGNLRCVTLDCEQYQFVTDVACKQAGLGGKCTTDGTRCVLRKSCEEATTEDACRFNDLGQQCIWNPPTATSDAYCKISVCELASQQDFVSEFQCKSHNPGCTLKKTGGCKQISDCNSFESEQSCKISKDGKVCVWEKDKGCRSNACEDISGTDHFQCKSQNKICTTSKTGKCANMAGSCGEYLIEGSCVETSDGSPCLWVKPLKNENYPLGQCIPYMKCEDIPLTTDTQCKSVLQNCTSNGSTCSAIKKCEDLTSVNCNKGSDGQCMLALKDATSATKICMVFKSCSDAYYKTHSECQGVSLNCTTSGAQCMELKYNCSDYSDKSSCFITKAQSNNSSSSTGICVWDKSCRNQACPDISGTTHKFCNQKMYTCTSDGTKCMTIETCESYTTIAKCTYGYGKISGSLNNPCYWTDVTKDSGSHCKVKTCANVLPASTYFCSEITDCVYDATKQSCITKQSSCSSYEDQVACNSGTTSSKNCFWSTDKKCMEVSNCDAIPDQNQCLSLKGCSYITKNGTSKCVASDCQNIYEQTNSCKFYETFQNDFKTCSLSNGQCSYADPSNLKIDNCLVNSNYTYTWSSKESKCVTCQIVVNNTGNSSECNTTTTNCPNGPTDSAQKMSIAMIFIAMILG